MVPDHIHRCRYEQITQQSLRVALCGLSMAVHSPVAALESGGDDLEASCLALVRAANGKGGDDNITAVIARVRESP